MPQDLFPASLRLEDYLDHFAYRALAAHRLGHVMRLTLHLGPRICHRDCQAYAVHDHCIGEIVADVRHIFGRNFCIGQNLLQNRDLLNVALIYVCHLHLARPLHRRRRLTAADHAGLDAIPVQPLQTNPVLRIEALRLQHLAVGPRNLIQLAVGENSVHIHQQKLHARGAILSGHKGGRRRPRGYNRTVLQRVREVITRYNMLKPGDSVGIAVSGGADSVCLLHLLTALSRELQLALTVLHLNHGLRGEESDADESFVAQLASDLGWPAVTRRTVLDPAENLEQAAREARLNFFRNTICSHGLRRVATGHTRDDQAETVLFRFLRGSGTAGLAGIRPVTEEGLIRPLLESSRVEIEAWLRERNLHWRDDTTNSSADFARNRIRRQLLPQLEREWNPNLRHTLFQTAEWARAEESYWSSEIDALSASRLACKNGFVFTNVELLAGLPVAAARRLARRAIELVKGDLRGIDFLHVEAILAMAASVQGHGRVQAPGIDVFRSFNRVRFGPISGSGAKDRNYREEVDVPGIARVPAAGVEVVLELIENGSKMGTSPIVYNGNMGWLDRDRVSGSLILRNWRPGDQYQPVGRASAEKIKLLFQEFRIPIWERRHWPVLVDCHQSGTGESIVWSRRFGVAAHVAAEPGCSRVLQIRESGEGS